MRKVCSSLVRIKSEKFITPTLTPSHRLEDGVEDRQQKVPGFSQQAIRDLTVTMVGAGGLGTEIGEGLVRKGVKELKIIDHDKVALSNLNRQKFYQEDLYNNKAKSLARNLRKEGAMGTILSFYPGKFQPAVEEFNLSADVVICGVDNDRCRVSVARYCYHQHIPAIFTAVSREADHGYLMIQTPGKACWGCAFPQDAKKREGEPCPGSPAVKDILKLMGGLVLYGVDSLFMDRPRKWNYREVYLPDPQLGRAGTVNKKDDCPICGG